jgi:HlyD family secretion protein
MTIADPGSIITEVFVDEADVADVRVGQAAEIVAIAYPDQPLTGVVVFIANTAKAETNRSGLSFLVRISITDANGIKLRPGMSCRAAIFTQSEDDVLSVPVQAILTEEEPGTRALHQFVYVERDGVARKMSVGTGLSDDEYQEITAGLQRNDRVITGPARVLRRLQDGDEVADQQDQD